MNRKEKLEMLHRLSEAELTKKFLIPLFESEGMGCKNVRYTHKRLEFGKDIIYYKEDEYGNRIYTGIQVKKTTISTRNIDNLLRQTTEAFGEPFTDLGDGKKKDLDRFVVLTSNKFLEEANESFRASLRGAKLDKLVTCVDGYKLVSLLEKHMPSVFWKEYEYFTRYFNAMKEDFTKIEDISAIGQKTNTYTEEIYVRLNLSEELVEGEIGEDDEEEWMVYQEEKTDVRDEKGEQLSKIERRRIVDAEKAVMMHDRLVIIGGTGSGKTTLVKYLALKSCKENLKRQQRICVPVPVMLRELADSGKSLRAYIDKVFEKYKFPKAKKYIEKDLKNGRCRLLLDGFDELATKESQKKIAGKINRFAKKYRKSKIVVTSRPTGYQDELKGFTKLEVMKFDERQIEKFIENWFGESNAAKAKSMYEVVKGTKRIKELARNPLMIAIIAIIYEEDMELPQRRADLYKRCVEVLLSKWDMQKRVRNKYASEKKEFILRKLAFYGHTNHKRIMSEDEVVTELKKHIPNIGLKEKDSKPFLDEIWKRSYLLRKISMKSYDFLHLSFQEYFTALELKEIKDGINTIIKYFHKPWWEEPILLYAGISRDASVLIKAVEEKVQEDMFYSNLMMFGKCIADAEFTDVSLRKRIVNDIWVLYRNSEHRPLRKKSIKILGLIKPDEIIVQLIRDLKKKEIKNIIDRNKRIRAATALGHIGSEVAIEPLCKALVDDGAHLRGRAVSALGNIGSEEAIESLLETLAKDDSLHVRGRTASALGRIGSKVAVEPLIKAMVNDYEAHVRGRAASALGYIGSEVAIEPLCGALAEDDSAHVRGTAASALGNIGSEVAIEPLLEVISKDDSAHVRGRATSALGRIGSDVAIEPLIKALTKDNNAYVRGMAASALGRIQNEVAIEPLLKAMVNDCEAHVRGRALNALGKIGCDMIVEILLDALIKDDEAVVRWYIISGLGRIGSEVATKPILEVLEKDNNAYVRGKAAYVLGRIGNEVAIEPLTEALAKDDSAHVRGHAALALGYIGSVKAVGELQKALKDEAILLKWKVKDFAFVALEKIGKRESAEM